LKKKTTINLTCYKVLIYISKPDKTHETYLTQHEYVINYDGNDCHEKYMNLR